MACLDLLKYRIRLKDYLLPRIYSIKSPLFYPIFLIVLITVRLRCSIRLNVEWLSGSRFKSLTSQSVPYGPLLSVILVWSGVRGSSSFISVFRFKNKSQSLSRSSILSLFHQRKVAFWLSRHALFSNRNSTRSNCSHWTALDRFSHIGIGCKMHIRFRAAFSDHIIQTPPI